MFTFVLLHCHVNNLVSPSRLTYFPCIFFFPPPLQAHRVQPRQCRHQVQLLHPQLGSATILWSSGKWWTHPVLFPQDIHPETGGSHPPRFHLLLSEEIQPWQTLCEFRQSCAIFLFRFINFSCSISYLELNWHLIYVAVSLPVLSVQTYVVRILRDGHNEPQFVFRTFDEFQELHNKLTILFPLWKLPR